MRSLICVFLTVLILGCNPQPSQNQQPSIKAFSDIPSLREYQTTATPAYVSKTGETEPDKSTQCPIPMKDRVLNRNGSQCVWASLEALGRWAKEPKLMNPPLTSRRDCQSTSGPEGVARLLVELKVRFAQSFGDKQKGLRLIRSAMEDGRGCLWGANHEHAMVIVHFDEDAQIVKIIDNSDSSLKIQKMSLDSFKQVWDSWVVVIYADEDQFGISPIRMLPIIDRNNPQQTYPKDYIPLPMN